jgi:hypothetical protein
MKMDWKLTPDVIEVRVSFDGDDDLRGKVTVRLEVADTKEKLGQVEPDKAGLCTFPRPKPGKYRFVAEDDGFGHRAERTFEVTDNTQTTASEESTRPRGMMIAIGLGVIGVLTLAGYWFAGRKKA